jgi:hypothetical protein
MPRRGGYSALMKLIGRLFFLLFLLAGVLVAVENPQRVEIGMWPLADRIAPPLFLTLISLLFCGVVGGLTLGWFAAGKHRRLARQRGEALDRMGREQARLKDELATLRAAVPADRVPPGPVEQRALARQAALIEPERLPAVAGGKR